MDVREGYLHDYLAASFIGLAIGIVISLPTSNAIGDWGPFIGLLFLTGLFGFVPGGFVAGYINFRLHRMGENLEMAGLSAGFFTAIVYTIVNLFISLSYAIRFQPAAGNIFIGWILCVLFAFLLFPLGGYLSGYLERRPFAMPGIFNLSRISRAPPPPPVTNAQICPVCGQQMTFIQQYGRWYCANCKKYP